MSKMSSIEVCVFINLNHFDCILKSSPGTVTSVCRSIWRDECPIMTMPRSSSSPRRRLTGQIHIVRLTVTAAAADYDHYDQYDRLNCFTVTVIAPFTARCGVTYTPQRPRQAPLMIATTTTTMALPRSSSKSANAIVVNT